MGVSSLRSITGTTKACLSSFCAWLLLAKVKDTQRVGRGCSAIYEINHNAIDSSVSFEDALRWKIGRLSTGKGTPFDDGADSNYTYI